ncbi:MULTISPECIES: 30S ribosomal protein S18 [Youngiibacter]|jgi:small subunit ribosomal protein S18|uniref:Small ribosomal subunit protein bS18 n=2 Tax=Youngiibacter TaxID=1408818 RepID=V7I7Q7_9CLOT|nr:MULTISPECIES: 30S ribosomal protein S18 [Youngiibacter]ETA81306.1 30S ribosomal protein S18 [Youngiibacter fragilis 232.1]MBP1917565.1 small subunit ribosomal protein S18 [Youngiibacter multivorans]
MSRENSRDFKKGNPRVRRAKRKVCSFCVDKVDSIDYKDVAKLRKYVTERGKILPRRISGTCAKHQRALTESIKRARNIALLPFTTE